MRAANLDLSHREGRVEAGRKHSCTIIFDCEDRCFKIRDASPQARALGDVVSPAGTLTIIISRLFTCVLPVRAKLSMREI